MDVKCKILVYLHCVWDFFFPFIVISWRLITLQYCSGFCHTLTWISHGLCVTPLWVISISGCENAWVCVVVNVCVCALLSIRLQIIVNCKHIFLSPPRLRPGLSFCLKFSLISWHFIHINGSPPFHSLPETVPRGCQGTHSSSFPIPGKADRDSNQIIPLG